MQNRTNQFQHPCSGVRAAYTNCQLIKPNNLVPIEPSTVHSTHTHFYQTNYRGGPLVYETRVCFYVPPRVRSFDNLRHLVHNTIQLLLEISNLPFVCQILIFFKHLIRFFDRDKSSVGGATTRHNQHVQRLARHWLVRNRE